MANRTKNNTELIEHVCRLIEEGGHTIAEICALAGISERSYYNYNKLNAESAVAFARARENANQIIVKEAKNSLVKLLEGFEVVETETKTRNLKNGGRRVTTIIKTRHVPADLKAIITVLTSKAPEEFKNRNTTKLTGKKV